MGWIKYGLGSPCPRADFTNVTFDNWCGSATAITAVQISLSPSEDGPWTTLLPWSSIEGGSQQWDVTAAVHDDPGAALKAALDAVRFPGVLTDEFRLAGASLERKVPYELLNFQGQGWVKAGEWDQRETTKFHLKLQLLGPPAGCELL